MAYSREELLSAAQAASSQGDQAMARKLGRMVMQQDAQQESRQQENDAWTNEMMRTDEGFGKNSLVALGRGFNNMLEGVQDLGYRATGNDDALARLNQESESNQAGWDRFSDENPVTAGVGEFVGEVGALAPLSMGMGIAAKGIQGTAKGLSYAQRSALAYGEGALTGALTTKGGFEERAKGAAIEGVASGVADRAFALGGRALGRRAARKANVAYGIADEEKFIANKIDDIREKGGYEMDAADASGRETAMSARDSARNVNDRSQKLFEAGQEVDIANKAQSFADETGGVQRTPIEIADELQSVLSTERKADLTEVDDAYNAWRASHGSNVKVDTKGFMALVDKQLKGIPEGQRGVVKKVKNIMRRKKIDGGKPLSIDDVETVIQEINSLYKPNDVKYNNAAKEIKKALDGWVDEGWPALGGMEPTHPVRLGKEARKKAREMYAKWDTGDIVDKMTSFSPGTENLRKNPLDAVAALNQGRNFKELGALKLKLKGSKDPRSAQLWADMEAAPIFAAMDKAMPLHGSNTRGEGGQRLFNSSVFSKQIGLLNKETQDLLWGTDGAGKINDAISAWSDRGIKIATRSNPNTSGTARAVAQTGVRLGAMGRVGGKVLAVLPWVGEVMQKVEAKRFKAGGAALRAGKLDSGSIEQLTKDLTAEFKDRMPKMTTKYPRAVGFMIRELARDMANGEDQ